MPFKYFNFQDLLDALGEPAIRHATWAHLPTALAAVGLLFIILLLLTGGRSHWLRGVTALLYALAAATAYFTVTAGEDAMAALSPQAREALAPRLDAHAWLGQSAWILCATTFGLVALSAIGGLGLRAIFLMLMLAGGIATAAWMGMTSHHGARLVYTHGAGVGPVGSNVVPAAPLAPPTPPQPPQKVEPDEPHRPPPPPRDEAAPADAPADASQNSPDDA